MSLFGGLGFGGIMKGLTASAMKQSPIMRALTAVNGGGGMLDFKNGQPAPVIDLASLEQPSANATMTDAPKTPYVDPQVKSQPATPPPAVAKAEKSGNWEPYLRQTAQKYGVDPDTLIRVVKSEGGLNGWIQSNARNKQGIREPSYGPLQMLVGGEGTGFPEGMGNQFMRETGLDPRDPKNAEAALDFAVQQASRLGWGQWYGAAKVGVGKMDGIGGRPTGVAQTATGPSLASTKPEAGVGSGTALDRVLAAMTGGSAPSSRWTEDPNAKAPPQTPAQRVAEAVMANAGSSTPVQAPQLDPNLGDMPAPVDLGIEELAGLQQEQAQTRMQGSQRAADRKEKLKAATRHRKA